MFKMSNELYDALKWLCIAILPAISTAVGIIFPIWGIPYGDQIAKTITAIATCIGACLGISSINYNKANGSIPMPDDEEEVNNNEVGEG